MTEPMFDETGEPTEPKPTEPPTESEVEPAEPTLPPNWRATDPDTSMEAGLSVNATERVKDLLPSWAAAGERGLTKDDLVDIHRYNGLGGDSPWHAATDGLRLGWLELAVDDDGHPIRRVGRSNRRQQVTVITAAGRAALRRLR